MSDMDTVCPPCQAHGYRICSHKVDSLTVSVGRLEPEPADEWEDHREGVVDGECDRCGIVRPVLLSEDPFLAEVYPPEDDEPPLERTWWCYPCYSDRHDEV